MQVHYKRFCEGGAGEKSRLFGMSHPSNGRNDKEPKHKALRLIYRMKRSQCVNIWLSQPGIKVFSSAPYVNLVVGLVCTVLLACQLSQRQLLCLVDTATRNTMCGIMSEAAGTVMVICMCYMHVLWSYACVMVIGMCTRYDKAPGSGLQ